MQELPEINVQDFESAVLANEQRLYSLTGGKSSFSESSVGVTLLELLTFLQTEQQRSMNRITADSLRSLCALYGYEPRSSRPAEAYGAYYSDRLIPSGTKLYADDIVFETQQDCQAGNISAAAYAKVAEGRMEPYRYDRDGAFCFEIFDGSDDLVIGLDKPLNSGQEHRLLMCFDNSDRKLPESMDGFDSGTEILWQYLGSDGNKAVWRDVELVRDDTFGFFCTGTVRFRINGQHVKNGNVYPIRAKLVRRGFDRLPLFSGAFVQNCRLLQLDTKSVCVQFSAEEFRKNAMFFNNYLAESGESALYIRTAQGWRSAGSLRVAFEIDKSGDGHRLVTSSRKQLKELFSKLSVQDDSPVMLLVIYEQGYVRDFSRMDSNGTSGQRIRLNYTGIFPERLRLLVGTDGAYSEWRYVDSLLKHGCEEVFSLDGDTLVFGDNIHGKIPAQGEIILISLSLTLGAGGNIPAGSLTGADGVTVKRPAAATGGVTGESPADTFARILREPKEKTLLSEDDFAECARSTPGLLIKQAQVLQTPDKNGGTKPNAVTVIIHPEISHPEKNTARLDWYLSEVRRHMKPLCPMTLELTLRFPKYLPTDISINVRSRDYYISAENTVRKFVEGYFAELRHSADRSLLIKEISSLHGISSVSALTIRCSGAEAIRRPDGSVTAPEWCRLYIRNLEISCEE